LAQILGVDPFTILNWERGKTKPARALHRAKLEEIGLLTPTSEGASLTTA
jgi:hypothetical protein